jgi:hypothetical protein
VSTVDFLGIGAQKGGTTWLFRQLSRHPQVAFPCGKEVRYWGAHESPSADEWVEMLQPASRWTPDGRQVRTGEITPAYALLPEPAIRAIRDRCPAIRLFMSLRNPIERAWSAACMELARSGMRIEEATDVWFLEQFRAEGSRRRGDYTGSLDRWWSVFPREQMHLLFTEDIARQPADTLAALATHLDLDAADFAALPPQVLEEVVVPSVGANVSAAPLRQHLFGPLLDIHGPDIERLERLLGANFASWRQPPPPPRSVARIAIPWCAPTKDA